MSKKVKNSPSMDFELSEKERLIMKMIQRLQTLQRASKAIEQAELKAYKTDPPLAEVDLLKKQLKSVGITLKEVMESLSRDLEALKRESGAIDDLPSG